jgi:uncharacterized protein YeeX (DUF496 family)
MNQNSENKQFMYGDDYRDALNDYLDSLDNDIKRALLYDFIFEYMETSMTNEQVQQFIDTGEW